MISEIEQQGYSAGDCDDQATLTYTLLNMIGIPAALRVAWYGKTMPQHIYTVAFINGTWTPYDTTSRYGVEPKASKVMDFT